MALQPDPTKRVEIHSIAPDGSVGILNHFPGENGAISASMNRYEAQRKLIEDAEVIAGRWREVCPFHSIKVILV